MKLAHVCHESAPTYRLLRFEPETQSIPRCSLSQSPLKSCLQSSHATCEMMIAGKNETSDLVGSFPLKFPGVKRTSKLISIPFIIPVLSQYYPIIIPSLSSKSWSWFQPVQRSAGGFAMEVSMLAMDSPNGGKRVVFWGNDDPIFRAPGLIAKFNKNNSNNYGLYVSDTQATIVN